MKLLITSFATILVLILCHGAIINGPFVGPPSVNDETAYWKLDEDGASTRVDSGPNGQDLTPDDTMSRTNGIISFAASNPLEGNWIARTDSATLSCGDIDFSLGAWIMLYDGNTRGYVVKGGLGSAAAFEYGFYVVSSKLRFGVSNGTTLNFAETASTVSFNAWHYVVGWHDAAGNTVNIQIDNGTPVSTAHSVGCQDSTGPFRIGRASDGFEMNGNVDEVGFWKRTLTSTERTYLYNSGAGKTCCPFN